MKGWRLFLSRQTQKDRTASPRPGLAGGKAERLLAILKEDPSRLPPRFEKLVGGLAGAWSRRLSILHRLVYRVLED